MTVDNRQATPYKALFVVAVPPQHFIFPTLIPLFPQAPSILGLTTSSFYTRRVSETFSIRFASSQAATSAVIMQSTSSIVGPVAQSV
jgi:hypothetical protein